MGVKSLKMNKCKILLKFHTTHVTRAAYYAFLPSNLAFFKVQQLDMLCYVK